MDFRLLPTSDLRWSRGSRGLAARHPAGPGGRVAVQTPLCPCRVTVHRPGMYRLDLVLRPDLPAHAAFADWLREVDASAAADVAENHAEEGRSQSKCVYGDGVRLMVFSDTPTYDESGAMSAQLLDAAGCACVLELSGAWTSDSRWGLRWRVARLKFVRELTLPPAPPAETEEDGDDDDSVDQEQARRVALAFLNDL